MRLVVWGTDVNVQETKTRFRQFLETFDVQSEDEAPLVENALPLYMQRLEEVRALRTPYLGEYYYVDSAKFMMLPNGLLCCVNVLKYCTSSSPLTLLLPFSVFLAWAFSLNSLRNGVKHKWSHLKVS